MSKPNYYINDHAVIDDNVKIGAGAVVTKDVPDYALLLGNPAKQRGWMSRHGHPLKNTDAEGVMTCPESGLRYTLVDETTLRCIDLNENDPLPEELSVGSAAYREVADPVKSTWQKARGKQQPEKKEKP